MARAARDRARAAPPGRRRPAPGLLDLSLPWETLAGASPAPGHLGRIGPVTATQARALAGCAARDPATQWRIIITDPAGHAQAITRIPRPRQRGRPPPDSPASGTTGGTTGSTSQQPGTAAGGGLVSRVTLTIPENLLTPGAPTPGAPTPGAPTPGAPPARPPPAKSSAGPDRPGGILSRALNAATAAAARAHATALADAAAGGCAHAAASPGYRPPPRLRDHITARDLTCRSPVCRQPAWRGELDHTIPWNQGPTCACNLGGICKADHLLKHHPGWQLAQTTPGTFTWTTPSGRTFTTTPDTHPL